MFNESKRLSLGAINKTPSFDEIAISFGGLELSTPESLINPFIFSVTNSSSVSIEGTNDSRLIKSGSTDLPRRDLVFVNTCSFLLIMKGSLFS